MKTRSVLGLALLLGEGDTVRTAKDQVSKTHNILRCASSGWGARAHAGRDARALPFAADAARGAPQRRCAHTHCAERTKQTPHTQHSNPRLQTIPPQTTQDACVRAQ